MAVVLSAEARRLIDLRRAQGRGTDICLSVEVLPVHGAGSRVLSASWISKQRAKRGRIQRRVGDVVLHMDERIARYTRWHDMTLSGWRLGPFSRLVIVDEPLVMSRLMSWVRLHPEVDRQPAA